MREKIRLECQGSRDGAELQFRALMLLDVLLWALNHTAPIAVLQESAAGSAAAEQEGFVGAHGPNFSGAFSLVSSSTRHLHNFPSGREVFGVNKCAGAADTINVFEGNRLSNLGLGSCGDFCFTVSRDSLT